MAARRLILGTAGHIDHGKTSLVEALTGVNTDRLEEERTRGISIELGFAQLDLDGLQLGLVDVPGHERFIRNMLAGATGIDLAMLVIAADDSVMPQTREHLAILRLLRVPAGVLVITKADLVDPAWLDLVAEDVRQLVAGTALADAPIVRTSATTGAGLAELRQHLRNVADRVQPRIDRGPFQMSIDRCFALRGLGTIVTGTVWSGHVQDGDIVELLPTREQVRIRNVQSHGASVAQVTPGERAAIQLAGVHHSSIERGAVLATPGYLAPSRLISVRMTVLPDSPFAIRNDMRVRVHAGTQEVIARVAILGEANQIEPGHDGLTQLHCQDPIVVTGHQPLVVRSESPVRTLGGGEVLQPCAQRIRRTDASRIEMLRILGSDDAAERIAASVWFLGHQPMGDLTLCRDGAVPIDQVQPALEQLTAEGVLVRMAVEREEPRLLHCAHRDALVDRLSRTLQRLHEENPLLAALSSSQIASRMPDIDEPLLAALLAYAAEHRRIVINERGIRLSTFQPKLSDQQRQLLDRLVQTFDEARFEPPTIESLAQQRIGSEAEIQKVIKIGAAVGDLAHIDGPLFMHARHEQAMRELIGSEVQKQPDGLTIAQIRDLLGTSRKYVVPMCEYLDRIGITARKGDRRVPGRRHDAPTHAEQPG